jgi:hypothetical protein
VREHNIVVDYTLVSTRGNTDAAPTPSLVLLQQVAARL